MQIHHSTPRRLHRGRPDRPRQPAHGHAGPAGAAQGPQRTTVRDHLRPDRGGGDRPGLRDRLLDRGQPSGHSWPTTNFLLCDARPVVAAVLRRVGLPQFLPLHETVEDALDQVAAIPPYLRHELQPPATATAPSAARRYVRDLLHLAVHDADPRHLHLVPADPRPTTAWSGSSGWPPPGGPPAARRRQDRLVHPTPVTPAPRSGAP
jgi:hypothetical protein